jgi:DNA-binding transcriptional LysR family regulator
MNLKALEAIAWTSKLGGMSAAARYLNVTQPAISARIRELELELGVSLFERRGRALRLTPQGKALVNYAQQIAIIEHNIRSLGDPAQISGNYRIGVGETIATSWLPALIKASNHQFPAIKLDFEVDLSPNLMRKLRVGQLDALLFAPLERTQGVIWERLGAVALDWFTAPGIHIADGVAQPADFSRVPIVGLTEDTSISQRIAEWLGRSGVQLQNVSTCNSLGTVVALARAGIGACVVPTLSVTRDVNDGYLVRIPCEPALGSIDFWLGHMALNDHFLSILLPDLACGVWNFP